MSLNAESMWEPLWVASRAAILFAGHIGLAILLLCGIWLLEHVFVALWGHADPLLFDVVPVRYLFNFTDTCVLGVFAFCGTTETYRALRSR